MSEALKETKGNHHNSWTVAAAYIPLWYIKDPLSLEGDSTPKFVQEANSTIANAEFVQNVIPEPAPDLKLPDILVVKKVKNIEPGEELFVTYSFRCILAAAPRVSRAWNLCLLW